MGMDTMKKTFNIIGSFFLIALLSGCATISEDFKGVIGISTKVLEDERKNAIAKTFDYDYATCFAKVEKAIPAMANVKTSVYDKSINKGMIALYYVDINTTPVGIFFKEVDKTHTEVEVSSASPTAKELIAKELFAGLQPKEDATK